MALKKLPGGVVVETEAGARLNEDAGINLEAIHRQLSGAASAAMDALKTKADITALDGVRATAQTAQSTALDARATANTASSVAGSAQTAAGNAVDRVTALESAAGFGPSTPTDGTMASYLARPDTETGGYVARTYVPRRDTSTYQLYVAPGGSDTNDGLTASTPLATIQAAFNKVEASGPIAQGQWYINLAAGTYAVGNAQQVLYARSVNPVVVRGPEVGGHPNVPTAILDGAGGGAYRHGIRAIGAGVNLELRDIKFVGFTTGAGDITRIAICGEHGADIQAVNCHVDGASWAGFYAFNTNRALIKGGIYDRCRFGANVNDTQASVTDGARFTRSTEAGVGWTRGSNGHLDYCELDDNAVGLVINGASRVGTVGNKIRRNNIGIKTEDGGQFGEVDPPNVMGIGDDANKWRDYEFGANSGYTNELKNGASPIRTKVERASRVLIGPTTPALFADLGKIPASRLWGSGKEASVRVDGTIIATAAGAYLEVRFGPVVVPLEFYGVPSSAAFRVEASLYEVTGGYRAFAHLMSNGEAVRTRSTFSAFDPRIDNQVSVYAATKTTDCRITMYRSSLTITG